MVSLRLWRDMLYLQTPGASRIQRPTGLRFRICSSSGRGTLSLTATLTLQSNGLQFTVLAVVGPTLTTLVMTSFATDVSGDEVVPDGFMKDVIAITLVTLVTPAVMSEGISKKFQAEGEEASGNCALD